MGGSCAIGLLQLPTHSHYESICYAAGTILHLLNIDHASLTSSPFLVDSLARKICKAISDHALTS